MNTTTTTAANDTPVLKLINNGLTIDIINLGIELCANGTVKFNMYSFKFPSDTNGFGFSVIIDGKYVSCSYLKAQNCFTVLATDPWGELRSVTIDNKTMFQNLKSTIV